MFLISLWLFISLMNGYQHVSVFHFFLFDSKVLVQNRKKSTIEINCSSRSALVSIFLLSEFVESAKYQTGILFTIADLQPYILLICS